MLAPRLEQAAKTFDGRAVIAKYDVDESSGRAGGMAGVRGIPRSSPSATAQVVRPAHRLPLAGRARRLHRKEPLSLARSPRGVGGRPPRMNPAAIRPDRGTAPVQFPIRTCISLTSTAPVSQLLDMAFSLEVDNAQRLRKQELMFAILKKKAKSVETIYGDGTLEILPDGFGFLRSPRLLLSRARTTSTSRPRRSAASTCTPATRSKAKCAPRRTANATSRSCASTR